MKTQFTTLTATQFDEQFWKKWNVFLSHLPEGSVSIQQTKGWVKLMCARFGENNIRCFCLTDEYGEICMASFGYMYPLFKNKYWLYLARGPIGNFGSDLSEGLLRVFLENIKISLKDNCVWVRFDPAIEHPMNVFADYLPAHASFHPKKTLVLDLKNTPDELLAACTQKGRYNIRLAEKKGVEIYGFAAHDNGYRQIIGNLLTDFPDPIEEYYKLSIETTDRDGFSHHQKKYYSDFLQALGPDKSFLLLAQCEGKWIAGGIFSYDFGVCTYYYGASANEFRSVMAPYLLQWQAILYAKDTLGAHTYDFLGIGEEVPTDPLYGVTTFKKRFGGRVVEDVGTFEMSVHPFLYRTIIFLKKLRKIQTLIKKYIK